nr:hypothetical protein [Tanacetum cinerariifolium]
NISYCESRSIHFLYQAVLEYSCGQALGCVTKLQALVDKKRIVITEEVGHEILQLNDAEGVICLPNDEIFAGLARMGYEKPSTKLTFYKAIFSTQWKFFIHTILHSLSQRFNFSKYIFESLVHNVDSTSKFYMYPRVGKGFSGVETPLFENILVVRVVDAKEAVQVPAQDDVVQEHFIEEIATEVVPPTPTSPSPSSPVLDKCYALVLRVEGLETANAAQQLEILKLKAKVKKLERLNKVKSSKLRRLKKVGTSQRIESSDDVENVFNQGRISVDMETDEGIELEVDQEKSAEIDAALAVSTRRRKGVVIRDPKEELHIDTPAETPTYIKRYHGFKKKPQSESEERKNMISFLKNTEGYKMEFFKGKTYDQILPIFQARFDANMKFLFKTREEIEKEDEEIIKSINETPTQKVAKRRKLSEEAQEANDLRGRLEIVQDEDDDVFFEAIPLAQKVPVVDYQVVVIDNRPGYKIIRADDTHQFYISFTTLLKNFDREDLETLWRIVKDGFSIKKPTNFLDEYLLLTLKTMFGELDEHDAIWRNQKSVHGLALVKRWKLLTSCGVHVIILSIVQLFLLVERRYLLFRFTLEQLVNVARLQVEEESKMSLELLR